MFVCLYLPCSAAIGAQMCARNYCTLALTGARAGAQGGRALGPPVARTAQSIRVLGGDSVFCRNARLSM